MRSLCGSWACYRTFIPYLHTVPLYPTFIPYLHTVPLYRTFIPYLHSVPSLPYLHTVPSYPTFIPYLHTVPSYPTFIPYLHTLPSLPYLHTVPSYRTFIPYLHTVPSYHTFIPYLPTLCSCQWWSLQSSLSVVVADCELRTRRVIKESTAENVEPFQSKMTHFITKGTLVNLMSVSSYKLPTAVTVWLISYTLLVSSDSLINSNYSSCQAADADELTQLMLMMPFSSSVAETYLTC